MLDAVEVPLPALIFAVLFGIARFENQRWVRARLNGTKGSHEGFGTFVDATGAVSLVFGILFFIAFGYDFGIISAILLDLAAMLAGMAVAALTGDSLVAWLVGTLTIWPLAGCLAVSRVPRGHGHLVRHA